MQTSRRDIFLLACCQALLLINASGLISMNGLIGFSLAQTKTLSTFGATTYVLGSAVATMPMSLWMGRVGRRAGFMTGALINVVGCCIAAYALSLRSFPLFCIATGIIGVYNAVGLQYRFLRRRLRRRRIARTRFRSFSPAESSAGSSVRRRLGSRATSSRRRSWGRSLRLRASR